MVTKYNIFAIHLDESAVKTKGDIADRIEGVKGVAATNRAVEQMAKDILEERNKKAKKEISFEDAWKEFINEEDGRFGYDPRSGSGIRKIIRAIPETFKLKYDPR